jgi:hypothetical protein
MRTKAAWQRTMLALLVVAIVMGLGIAPLLAYASERWELFAHNLADPLADEPAGTGLSLLVIPAAAFSSDGGFPDDFFFDFETGYLRGDNFACLKAPVYLPHGAVIDSIYASLYDNAYGNVAVTLRRVDVVSGSMEIMAAAGTTTDSTSIQQKEDITISYPEVSYPRYAYFLTTCLSSADHRVYSVRIYYAAHRVFLPMVLRDS